jgi:two-component system sensor histidine kinase CpxA
MVLVAADGSVYRVLVGPVSDTPRLFGELELPGVPTATLLIALAVSAALCFALARYLVRPIDRLRNATRQLAAGDLGVRVLPALKGRQDDLALLAADLDTMAERVVSLLEAKQQLLRDVSYELRSPLARLQLALSLAQSAQGDPARHLARIGAEADRLEELIARTLRLARLEAPAAQTVQREPLDLKALLAELVEGVEIEAEAQGSTVGLTADGPVIVSGDRELLRSAFENVIRNAVSFGPRGGRVQITIEHCAGTVRVHIVDQGVGVPDKDLRKIFEAFYRVDEARPHNRRGGHGLGLAIAARAVALHDGVIEAANVVTGGLRVTITLPALTSVPAQQEGAKVAAPA